MENSEAPTLLPNSAAIAACDCMAGLPRIHGLYPAAAQMMHSTYTSLLLCSLQPTGFHEHWKLPTTNGRSTQKMVEPAAVEAVE